MQELRCDGRLYGKVDHMSRLEVKCKEQICGARNGFVVFHVFGLATGAMLYTTRYKDPSRRSE